MLRPAREVLIRMPGRRKGFLRAAHEAVDPLDDQTPLFECRRESVDDILTEWTGVVFRLERTTQVGKESTAVFDPVEGGLRSVKSPRQRQGDESVDPSRHVPPQAEDQSHHPAGSA